MAQQEIDVEPQPFEPEATPASVYVLRSIWKHKALIALGMVGGIILGVLYYIQKDKSPVYQSQGRVVVKAKAEQPLSLQQGAEARSVYQVDDSAIQMEYFLGQMVSHMAAERLKDKPLQSLPAGLTVDQRAAAIRGMIAADRDKEAAWSGTIMKVSCRGPVPEECQIILNAVIASYEAFLAAQFKDDNQERRQKLEEHVKGQEEALEKTNLEIVRLRQADGQRANAEESRSEELMLGARRTNLANQVDIQERLQKRLTVLKAACDKGHVPTRLLRPVTEPPKALAAAAPATGPSIERDLLPLIRQKQRLEQTYGPDHPEVIAINNDIKTTQTLLTQHEWSNALLWESLGSADDEVPLKVAHVYLTALQEQLEEADGEVKRLQKLCEQSKHKLEEATTYNEMKLDLKKNQEKLEDNLKTNKDLLKALGIVTKGGGYNVTTTSAPTMGDKVEPKLLPILGMFLLAGMLAGCGLAWLAEVTDKSFQTPDDVRRRLGLQILGHIPYLVSDKDAEHKAQEMGSVLDPILCTFYRSRSVEAEGYRGVRTALYFSTQGEGLQVIQITSPNQGDGKTTLAANLAVCIAQSGKSCLLIDADFRRPRQHKLFGMTGEVGVASVIAGDADLEDALQETAVEGLTVLPCGGRPHNPAELLTSPAFEDLLATLREKFDFILIDTPPMLAVSDPSAVAPRVDGVLLTIRVSKHGRPAAQRAKEMLATLGAKILGVVVNGVGRKGHGGYENYQYGYGYTYGYSYTYDTEENKSYYQDQEAPPNAPAANTEPVQRPPLLPEVKKAPEAGKSPAAGADSEQEV